MTFRLVYAKSAEKQFNRLNLQTVLRIVKGCERLEINPFPDDKHIKKLKGYKNLYRLWVGDYRIVFRISEVVVEVIDIVSKPDFKKSY